MKLNIFWGLVGILIVFSGCQSEKTKTRPQLRQLTEAVYTTVTVVPREYYTVYPSVGGIIEERYVEEGDSVRRGQPLFQLSGRQSIVGEANARVAYELAQDNYSGNANSLLELSEQIAAARLRLRNDSLTFDKQSRLWSQGIGSEQQFDGAKLAFQTSQHELERLKNAYARTEQELASRVESARNNYRISQLGREDYGVSAKMDGRVYRIDSEVGEAVTPQTPLARIGSRENFILEMRVDEVDISRVALGQEVAVVLDAYPEEVFTATIEHLAPALDTRSQTFRVEGVFTTPPPRLFDGLSGEGNIVIGVREKVLALPTAYLSEGSQVLTDTGWKSVETGLANLEFTEIISGLDTSTVVYLNE